MKKYVIAILLFTIHQYTLACDICGCFMGITPYDNQSSISLNHRYRVFNGYRYYQSKSHFFPMGAYKMNHGEDSSTRYNKTYSSADYESYKVLELRVKYFIHKKIELNVFSGIVQNKSKSDTIKINHTGLNDPSLFIGYHLLQPNIEAKFKQRLILGLGIKLPSGNYYAKDKNQKRLPLLMQPGTGSVDYFTYINYVLGYKKIGVSTALNYKLNGTNFYKERVGNSVTNFTSFFYKFNTKNWAFIPSINSYYEYMHGIYVFDKLAENTGMNEWMCGLGFDVYYKNFGLNIGIQKTIHQHQSSENLKSVGRIFVNLSYNFNQRKFLLGKK